eukprot:jgi/Chrzof1/11359/Cz05g33200.t1
MFKQQIEQITGFPFNNQVHVTFVCKVPQSGSNVQLQGMASFQAAMHCASVSAAERCLQKGADDIPLQCDQSEHPDTVPGMAMEEHPNISVCSTTSPVQSPQQCSQENVATGSTHGEGNADVDASPGTPVSSSSSLPAIPCNRNVMQPGLSPSCVAAQPSRQPVSTLLRQSSGGTKNWSHGVKELFGRMVHRAASHVAIPMP